MLLTSEISRENLHMLVDRLPECEWEVVHYTLLAHLKQQDPLLWALMTCPVVDKEEELETEEDRLAIEEAREDIKSGRTIPHEEIERRYLGS